MPARNTWRSSAPPSPSASRSSVMRSALGTAEPAVFCALAMISALTPLRELGRSGKVFLLLLAIYWAPVRRVLVGVLPENLRAKLPPTDTAAKAQAETFE